MVRLCAPLVLDVIFNVPSEFTDAVTRALVPPLALIAAAANWALVSPTARVTVAAAPPSNEKLIVLPC